VDLLSGCPDVAPRCSARWFLNARGLLDVERLEIPEAIERLEPVDRLRRAVDGGFALALRRLQEAEVTALDALVGWIVLNHVGCPLSEVTVYEGDGGIA